jgi:DNA helicase-4
MLLSDLVELGEETQFSILSPNDREALEEVQDSVASIKSHFKDYNPEFVRRQREKCTPLFSEIGPNQLDLTEQQERAIIRNGIYNQVVAAAGTGKTLTLTTRVAYLIREQDVDPEKILVITYTNEATNEMKTRLEDHFDITTVDIRTFHSFGREIIQDEQDEHVESIDPLQKENFIDSQIREARDDPKSEFLDHYYEFLVHFDDVYYEGEDFETKKEYIEARADQDYATLRGEEVNSRAEKLIADFLFTHQVDYRYEDLAPWADTAPEKGEYYPDFYLPEYETYIEHWGVDESGSVAPWFSWPSGEYRAKMKWARREFDVSAHSLVETYEFENDAGRLKQALRHRLTAHGIELNQMDFDELVETAFEYEQREGWIKDQFRAFIENAKRFGVMPETIEKNLSESNPRQYHFGQCGIHILQQYALFLMENGLIDYTDMIHDAVDIIQDRPNEYTHRYDHLLVDEFQDIGEGELELIQELSGPEAARLFAVGDDWQSIFSFKGAVIDYFTDFEDYFGAPVRTELTKNFRSPQRIVNAGNQLIENNSEQLEKEVVLTVSRETTPKVHTLQGYTHYDYVRRVRRYALDLVQRYQSQGADPSDIMILCRFDDAVPYLDEVKKGLRSLEIPYIGKSDNYRGPDDQSADGVAVYSLYQAKGREAKHVILLHAAEGSYGFPPADRDNELIEPVQPLPLGGTQEERRAFYVAITRSKQTLDLLTRREKESQFLDEISSFTETVDAGKVEPLDEIGEYMAVKAKVDKLLDPWTNQHQRGFLGDRYGGSARFVSWQNNDPPTLEEGEWYSLTGVRVGEYKDEKELVLTQDCSVTHLPDGP